MKILAVIPAYNEEECLANTVSELTQKCPHIDYLVVNDGSKDSTPQICDELRLNHAAMLLVTTDSPIIEIASKSGFNNLSNFNRAFKMYFGKTPSAYRKG